MLGSVHVWSAHAWIMTRYLIHVCRQAKLCLQQLTQPFYSCLSCLTGVFTECRLCFGGEQCHANGSELYSILTSDMLTDIHDQPHSRLVRKLHRKVLFKNTRFRFVCASLQLSQTHISIQTECTRRQAYVWSSTVQAYKDQSAVDKII